MHLPCSIQQFRHQVVETIQLVIARLLVFSREGVPPNSFLTAGSLELWALARMLKPTQPLWTVMCVIHRCSGGENNIKGVQVKVNLRWSKVQVDQANQSPSQLHPHLQLLWTLLAAWIH